MTTDEFASIVTRLDRDRAAPALRPALHRVRLPADARAARVPAGQRLQDVHRLRRRRRVHAPVDRAGLRHPAGAGRRQHASRPKYELRDGKPVLVRLPEIDFVDDKAGKPVGIHAVHRPPADRSPSATPTATSRCSSGRTAGPRPALRPDRPPHRRRARVRLRPRSQVGTLDRALLDAAPRKLDRRRHEARLAPVFQSPMRRRPPWPTIQDREQTNGHSKHAPADGPSSRSRTDYVRSNKHARKSRTCSASRLIRASRSTPTATPSPTSSRPTRLASTPCARTPRSAARVPLGIPYDFTIERSPLRRRRANQSSIHVPRLDSEHWYLVQIRRRVRRGHREHRRHEGPPPGATTSLPAPSLTGRRRPRCTRFISRTTHGHRLGPRLRRGRSLRRRGPRRAARLPRPSALDVPPRGPRLSAAASRRPCASLRSRSRHICCSSSSSATHCRAISPSRPRPIAHRRVPCHRPRRPPTASTGASSIRPSCAASRAPAKPVRADRRPRPGSPSARSRTAGGIKMTGGRSGHDFALRAALAKHVLGAELATEILEPRSAHRSSDDALTGEHKYIARVPRRPLRRSPRSGTSPSHPRISGSSRTRSAATRSAACRTGLALADDGSLQDPVSSTAFRPLWRTGCPHRRATSP